MSNRQPRIVNIALSRENNDPPTIRALIAYDGLKGDQVDWVTISPKHAARIAAGLVQALHAFVPEGGVG